MPIWRRVPACAKLRAIILEDPISMTNPADGRKLYQKVASAISAAIQAGTYKPGQKLPPERDLADEFAVSRPTVREAMIALDIMGLVEARHGSGIYVTGSKVEAAPADLDIGAFELTEARRLFEGEAAALAATTITDEELAELESILADMVEENRQDLQGEQADRRFHVTIAKSTRNSAIAMVVETLWDLRYKSPLCISMLERARQLGDRPRVDEHRDIVAALRTRDPRQARAAMHHHLGRVIDGLLTATELEAMQRAQMEVAAKRTEIARRTAL
jgi:GntR family transcriptional repressor for pyruvate dehydrogenase complex